MRSQFLQGLSAAGLIGALAVVSVPAGAAEVQGHVPFGFNVRGRTFPAGSYRISKAAVGALMVKGLSIGAFVGTTPLSGKSTTPKLLFHRYGDLYVLREVWMASGAAFLVPQIRDGREAIRAAREAKSASAGLDRVELPIR